MEYNYISENCGLQVSSICLGTMTFGAEFEELLGPGQTNQEDSLKILDRFAELGGNFIDTANIYTAGTSEKYIGTWLKKKERDDFVIATKCRNPVKLIDLHTPNKSGLSRRHIIHALEGSLERLQTDYVDLYQIHMPDMKTPLEETLRTMDDLVRCGKVRYLGASNMVGWQMQKLIDTCERMQLNPFVTIQQQYNLMERASEADVFQAILQEGLGIIPYSPLAMGLLTGKYRKGKDVPKDSRLGFISNNKTLLSTLQRADVHTEIGQDQFEPLMEAMDRMAKDHDASIPQIALKWLLQRPGVSSVIIGSTKLHQIEDNMKAGGKWRLTDKEMGELTSLTNITLPYPYKMFDMDAIAPKKK